MAKQDHHLLDPKSRHGVLCPDPSDDSVIPTGSWEASFSESFIPDLGR